MTRRTHDSVHDLVDDYAARKVKQRREATAAFEESPAVWIRGGGEYASTRLAILTPNMHGNRAEKSWRVSMFDAHGPYTHYDGDTRDVVIDYVLGDYTYTPATDDEVVAWTSTESFIEGSKRVAFVQVVNELSYRASGTPQHRQIHDAINAAQEGRHGDIEEATRSLQGMLKDLPSKNPARAGRTALVANPPWVTGLLARAFESLESKIPPQWLPKLDDVYAHRGRLMARMKEYGCGAYGCVLPTLDPTTVLKVTTDLTEAQFAKDYAQDLVAPICVDYRLVVELSDRHKGQPVFLLWREGAEQVGELRTAAGDAAADAVDLQHAAAQAAYAALHAAGRITSDVRRLLEVWRARCADMGRQPDLWSLATGMLAVYDEQKIFLGDIHDGNIGYVTRDHIGSWVITDPGHVAVLADL